MSIVEQWKNDCYTKFISPPPPHPQRNCGKLMFSVMSFGQSVQEDPCECCGSVQTCSLGNPIKHPFPSRGPDPWTCSKLFTCSSLIYWWSGGWSFCYINWLHTWCAPKMIRLMLVKCYVTWTKKYHFKVRWLTIWPVRRNIGTSQPQFSSCVHTLAVTRYESFHLTPSQKQSNQETCERSICNHWSWEN